MPVSELCEMYVIFTQSHSFALLQYWKGTKFSTEGRRNRACNVNENMVESFIFLNTMVRKIFLALIPNEC